MNVIYKNIVLKTLLKHLTLRNFRNHEDFSVDCGVPLIIITGDNGAGKTGILEAVSLLPHSRGMRAASMQEVERMPHTQQDGLRWSVFANIVSHGQEYDIGVGAMAKGGALKRQVRIDGKSATGKDASSLLRVLWLTPQMSHIFTGGATARRGLLDDICMLFSPEYESHISIFARTRAQRMKLLQGADADDIWLSTLEERMARYSVMIAATRLEVIDRLQQAANMQALPTPHMRIKGDIEGALEGAPAIEVENIYAQRLRDMRAQDGASGRTSVGTHRSDFVVEYVGRGIYAQDCSTGEQKSLLLSIIIRAAHAVKSMTGAAPIMLFDEVIAHLDTGKRAMLAREISQLGAQAWLTGTDKSLLTDFMDARGALMVDL